MEAPWHGLLANLAIVAIYTSIFTMAYRRIKPDGSIAHAFVLGGVMALGGITAMLLPFELAPGIRVDLRYGFVAVSAFFGGPPALLLTGGTTALYRLALGGTGALTGLIHIALAATSGFTGFTLLKNQIPSVKQIALLGIAVAFSGTVGFLQVPIEQWQIVVPSVVVPLGLLLFLSTTLCAFAIAQEKAHQLVANENRTYRAIIDALPDCVYAKNPVGSFLAANPATARHLNVPNVSDLIGKTDFAFRPTEIAQRLTADELKAYQAFEPQVIEQCYSGADGQLRWLSTLKVPYLDERGRLIGMITHSRDISEQKRVDADLECVRLHLASALKHMADGLVMFDAQGCLVFCNNRYRELFPLTADVRVPGTHFRDIVIAELERAETIVVEGADADRHIDNLCTALDTDGDHNIPLADGRWLYARTRLISGGGVLMVISDITKAKRAEENLLLLNHQLELMANTDGLTGLKNRRAFDSKLEKIDRQSLCPVSLLLVDIDRFKAYNDTYGHPSGDECLRQIAGCLRAAFGRSTAFVARYGGEELAAILPGVDLEEAFELAQAFRRSVRSLQISHHRSEKSIVTVSIGVASRQNVGGHIDHLVAAADEALYRAKAEGRDCVRRELIYTNQALRRAKA